jgi:hypothetical protein
MTEIRKLFAGDIVTINDTWGTDDAQFSRRNKAIQVIYNPPVNQKFKLSSRQRSAIHSYLWAYIEDWFRGVKIDGIEIAFWNEIIIPDKK